MADGTHDHVPLDPADRDFLREVRWRRDVVDDGESRRRRWILGVLVVVHVVFFAWLREAMLERGRLAVPVREQVMEVRFYDEAPQPEAQALPEYTAPLVPMPPDVVREVIVPVASAPLPAPVPPPPPPPQPVEEATPADAMSARFIAPETPPPQLRLYNEDGSMRLSQDVIDASNIPAPRPGYRSPLAEAARVKPRPPPISYDPTVFSKYWAPGSESAFDSLVRRSTASKKFRTPWGSTIQCTWVLIMGGCGWGIAPTPLEKPPPRPGEVYVDEPPKHW